MLPAMTCSPPNFLTPRRLDSESRPFRDEPPAFLCAISFILAFYFSGTRRGCISAPLAISKTSVSALCADDIQNLDPRQILAVPFFAPRTFAPALFEGDNLRPPRLRNNLGNHRGAINVRT